MLSWQPRKEHFLQMSELLSIPDRWTGLFSEDSISDDISNWLGRLDLLYGVPFNYLVPDERMLPIESIRFFYLDPNWMKILCDGACSIGRITSNDMTHDAVMKDTLHPISKRKSQSVRQKLIGGVQGREDIFEIDEPVGTRTGFLLRSALVDGWPGLEVMAFENQDHTENQRPLKILRMERLSKDILICIFAGVFQKLEIQEPAESLHFGADHSRSGDYTATLRGLGIGGFDVGIPIDQANLVVVPMRDESLGVVNVKGLANMLKDGIQKKQALGEEFTSAEFAVQLIESAKICVFDSTD
ncbi:MAG: hypothetical protein KAX49_08085 [Halanaerobiales bacterium]|nr:hypothetical protein [Halanaerobiales bacterium]